MDVPVTLDLIILLKSVTGSFNIFVCLLLASPTKVGVTKSWKLYSPYLFPRSGRSVTVEEMSEFDTPYVKSGQNYIAPE